MRLFNHKGQSTAEYAIIIGLVIGVLVVMQTYVKRGIQGRVRDASDANIYDLSSDANWAGVLNAQPTAVGQADAHWEFDKYSAERTRATQKGTETTETIASGGTVTRDVKEKTQQAESDYQKYDYTAPKK